MNLRVCYVTSLSSMAKKCAYEYNCKYDEIGGPTSFYIFVPSKRFCESLLSQSLAKPVFAKPVLTKNIWV